MKCGLVILNYNDFLTTQNLLNTVKDFHEIDCIAVVDNNSPNESYEILKKYESSRISVIQSGRNGGYSHGNNIGIRHLIRNCQPDIIGIANPDTVFTDSFVKRVKELFSCNLDYAIITGFQLNADKETGTHPFWENNESRASFAVKRLVYDVFLSPFVKIYRKIFRVKTASKYRKYCERIRNSPSVLNQVWAVEGSLFFIRTKDFEQAGLFDERIFMYYEENVLAEKLHRIGRKTGVANDITYIHNHKAPQPGKRSLSLTLFDRAGIFYYTRFYSDRKVLRAFLLLLIYCRKLKVLLAAIVKNRLKKVIQ